MKILNPVLAEAVALARGRMGNGGPSENEERHQCGGSETPKVRDDQNDQRPPSVVNVVSVVLAGVPDHVRPERNSLASDCFREPETARVYLRLIARLVETEATPSR